jgi:predicted permease
VRPLRRWWNRSAGLLAGGRRDADLADELQSHIDFQTDANIRAGMPHEQARREAILKFGAVEAAKEEYRDQRGWPGLESIVKDLRFALRTFRRRPSFTAVAVLSIGLGIGINATVFGWLKAVYLNPLPGVSNARDLVTVNASFKDREGFSNSYADFTLIRDYARSFKGVFAHEMLFASVSDGRTAEKMGGGFVSANFFEVLGVPPARGRLFGPQEDAAVGSDVVVLSHAMWHRKFGGDPRILGQRVLINRIPVTVIGVAAEPFRGVYGGIAQDYWVPLRFATALDERNLDISAKGSWMQIMGRLAPGASPAAVQAELDVLSAQARDSHRKTSPDYRAIAHPLHRAQRGFHAGFFQMVQVLAVAAFIVLLLACVNVAGLLLARANDRAREITIRFSLGASRGRIVRQLMIESFLLAGIGGAAGLIIAMASQSLPEVLSATGVEMVFNSSLDWSVAAFLAAATTVSALLFGLVPAIATSGLSVGEGLKQGAAHVTAGKRKSRFRGALVVVQVALSTAALASAAFVGETLLRAANSDRGFRAENVLTAEVDAASGGLDETGGRALYGGVIERLRTSPGVVDAAFTTFLPMSGHGGGNHRETEVRGYVPPEERPLSVVVDAVSAGYLRTLGIPLVQGREFDSSDVAGAPPVMLCNEKFAERYFAGREAVGAQVRIGNEWRTIVGVHRNFVYRHPSMPHEPAVLLPLEQDYSPAAIAIVRTRDRGASAAALLRAAVAEVNTEIALARVITMEQNIALRFLDLRIMSAVLAVFGLLCCTLAAIGLYGVLASFVNQRRREFGVRSALGATALEVAAMVFRQSAWFTGIGAVCGLGLAIGLARVLRSALFSAAPESAWIYIAATAGVFLTAMIASAPPFIAAARMDPVSALRHE